GGIDLAAAHALIARIISEPPPLLVRSDAPAGLAEMIADRMLAKAPATRYASMTDVKGALEAFGGVLQGDRITTWVTASEPDPAELGEISDQTMSGSRLSRAELEREVRQLGKRWALVGDDLELAVYSREMKRLAQVIGHVAELSDELEQRPRI